MNVTQCRPPLDEAELAGIIHRVLTHPDEAYYRR